MKKGISIKLILISMILLFIIGSVLIFSSRNIGEREAYNIVQSKGGTMATDLYNSIVNSVTLNYQIFGSLLSFFAEGGILLCIYILYKNSN